MIKINGDPLALWRVYRVIAELDPSKCWVVCADEPIIKAIHKHKIKPTNGLDRIGDWYGNPKLRYQPYRDSE